MGSSTIDEIGGRCWPSVRLAERIRRWGPYAAWVIFASLDTLMGLLGLVTLLLKAFCLVDAAARRPDAFTAAGKQTKVFWLVILGVAVAWNLFDANPIGLINIIGIIAALVYFLDVRPAVREVSGGGSGNGFGFGRRKPPSDW